jgi:hypothetical protein
MSISCPYERMRASSEVHRAFLKPNFVRNLKMKILKNLNILLAVLSISSAFAPFTCHADSMETESKTYYCQRRSVRTEAEQHSGCNLTVYWDSGNAGNRYARLFSASHSTRGRPNAQEDCSIAEAEARAKCEDYRRYDAYPQNSGSCELGDGYVCGDSVWE